MNNSSHRITGPLEPELPDNTSIKVIGLGGVGGITVRYLALFLTSLNKNLRLVLIDGDAFEPSNAARMLFSDHGNKAVVTRSDLLHWFKDSSLSFVAVKEYVSPKNIHRLIQTGDIVILAVDNHATRKLVNDFCMTLDELCLISGGNDGMEQDAPGRKRRGTYGNCQIYIRRGGRDLSPPLSQYHPEIREPADQSPEEKSCTQMVESVPQILFTNLAAASAILNAFWLYCCGALHYSELSFDIADGLMRPMSLPAPCLNQVVDCGF